MSSNGHDKDQGLMAIRAAFKDAQYLDADGKECANLRGPDMTPDCLPCRPMTNRSKKMSEQALAEGEDASFASKQCDEGEHGA